MSMTNPAESDRAPKTERLERLKELQAQGEAKASGATSSQQMRLGLNEYVSGIDVDKTRDFGSTRGAPTHQLVAIKSAAPDEIARGVRLTVDQARKAWTDLKACARILGIPFILTVDGKGRAVIRRHPENIPKRAPKWIQEYDERTSNEK